MNSTQLDMAGDGFKNYYTLAYQYKYGSGIHFDGFMYPYGDLATYADAQIFLVWILQGLRFIGLDFEPYLLGIINTLPLLSFIIAGLFLVRIFEHYRVSFPFAILFTVACIALSPQIFRVQSHYALAYAYIIPGIWWFNLRFEKANAKTWLWVTLSSLFILVHGFIHPYLIFIVSIFLLALFVSRLLITRTISLGILIQGVVPILSFLLVMKGLDGISDRPKNPYGLLIHKTDLSDLLPFFGWIKTVFGDLPLLKDHYSEGYTYVGMLFFIVPLLLVVKRASKQEGVVQDKINITSSLWSYMLTGLLCLACGMGLLIILSGGLILDLLPMLKQFRAMGRVSWLFYYTMFVFLGVVFYQLWDSIESKGFKWVLMILVISLWSLDIYSYHKALNKIVSTYNSVDLLNSSTLVKDMLDQEQIEPSRYQALWVLPSSSEGTEKISFRDDWSSKMNAIPFSYQTGLPLTSIVMSRASINNSLKIMQLSSSTYIEKELVNDLDSDKPFLIILQNDRLSLFKDILDRAQFISKQKDFSLYEIPIEEIKDVTKVSPRLYAKGDTSIQTNGIFLSFDNSGIDGLKSGGCKLINGEENIFEIAIDLQDSIDYSLSLWYKIMDDKSDVPYFKLQSLDGRSAVRFEESFRDWDMQRVEVIDNWIRLKRSYRFSEGDKKIRLIANGEFLHLDRVLLKQDGINFQSETRDSSFIQWNHVIGQKGL